MFKLPFGSLFWFLYGKVWGFFVLFVLIQNTPFLFRTSGLGTWEDLGKDFSKVPQLIFYWNKKQKTKKKTTTFSLPGGCHISKNALDYWKSGHQPYIWPVALNQGWLPAAPLTPNEEGFIISAVNDGFFVFTFVFVCLLNTVFVFSSSYVIFPGESLIFISKMHKLPHKKKITVLHPQDIFKCPNIKIR